MIYYIVAAVLIVIITFLIIFFYFKKSKNKKYQLITKTNNISLQDNQPSVMEVQSHDLDFFYNNFNEDDYHILGLSNIDRTINIAYQDTAVKSVVEVAKTIIQTKTLKSVFKATADPTTLMKLKDGVGSAVMENGKIIAQAGFVNINPAEMAGIIGPQVVFGILSIAVGQHFMAEISQKLSDISEKLDKILQHFKEEHIAKLQSAEKSILEVSKRENVGLEDIGILMVIEKELNEIYQYYKNKLKSIDIHDLIPSKWSKMKETSKKLKEKIDEAEFFLKMCFYSKELLNLIQLVKFDTYIKMKEVDINAINKANELFEKINSWQADLFYNEDVNPKNTYFNIVKECKLKCIRIYDNAKIKWTKKKIYNIIINGLDKKNNTELNNYISMSYNQSRTMIENMNKPKDIILLKDDSGNIISLCKKE
ncbi:hypothetical protein [Brachyspira catarrhinii]|uniref:Uncharacterized protein n=1 Tax=Brachyspira catarrhinii TaxID=2528966 RepID=A0ABY2TTW7_9SPIR|nr:hypothetical protein [Brachyspira catarrhinii]TKZ36204.1 hypothetical protein EZH24_01250 [Brachyspira catarrhinii]